MTTTTTAGQKRKQGHIIRAGDQVRREKADGVPEFAALSAAEQADDREPEYRKVRIPAHRYTPLRKSWPPIVTPLVVQPWKAESDKGGKVNFSAWKGN